jgi:helicase
VEQAFIHRKFLILVASPSLSAGVNVPAKWVLIDWQRWGSDGIEPLSVGEVKQMEGRSGRPQFDTEGFAIMCVAKDKPGAQEQLEEMYLRGSMDQIRSQFVAIKDVQKEVLGAICSGFATTTPDLIDLFQYTLAYHQSRKYQATLPTLITETITFLSDPEAPFIHRNTEANFWEPTPLGTKCNQLYLYPAVTLEFVHFVISARPVDLIPVNILYFLFGVCENLTKFYEHSADAEMLDQALLTLGTDFYGAEELEHDRAALKTALILIGDEYCPLTWTDENVSENQFYDHYDLGAGDLEHAIGATGEFRWILTSFQRIAIMYDHPDIADVLDRILVRLQYGVSKRLEELCLLKQVGFERSIALAKAGYLTIADVAAASIEDLGKIDVESNTDAGTTHKTLGVSIATTIHTDARKLLAKDTSE